MKDESQAIPSSSILPTNLERRREPWEGQRVRIEDLQGFAAMWGLRIVGSEWPEGAPRPFVSLVERWK